MRLETIELKNFRQFQDLTVTFNKKTGVGDLHVLLGKNGVGKTNILNAITWCLYNQEMHLGDKKTSLSIVNNKTVQDVREQLEEGSGKVAEVSVKLHFSSEDGSQKVVFKRVENFHIKQSSIVPINGDFRVQELNPDGSWSSYVEEEEVQAVVNKYVPETIHEYIFFDGEHLDHYFKSDQAKKIKDGIENLTQANIVQRTADAFRRYIHTDLESQLSNSGNKDVEELQLKIDTMKDSMAEAEKNHLEYQQQVKNYDSLIENCEQVIRGHENLKEKMSRLRQLDGQYKEYSELKQKKLGEFMTFVRDRYQYFALYPAILDYYKYIKEQDKNGKLPPKIDRNLLTEIVASHHCSVCNQDVNEDAIKHIEHLLKEFEIATNTANTMTRAEVLLLQYIAKVKNYKTARDRYQSELESINAHLQETDKEMTTLNSYLQTITDAGAITKAIGDRSEYKDQRDKAVVNAANEKNAYNRMFLQVRELEREMKDVIAKNNKLEAVYRQKEFCESCVKILSDIKDEVLNESRVEMQEETFDIFKQLLWKKDTFTRVEITEEYIFKLINIYGDQTLGSCSAAERALLALSFTLALQNVSGHDSLIFIDTPIGRVDDENRNNFINILLEIAQKKQVILTFTPTEYDTNVETLLAGNYSTFNQLNLKEGLTSTK